MLTIARHVARLSHPWLAVPCRTCNAEIGADCDPAVFGPGPHPAREEAAHLLGFRRTDQHALALEHPAARRWVGP
jgi:hypothetical protein